MMFKIDFTDLYIYIFLWAKNVSKTAMNGSIEKERLQRHARTFSEKKTYRVNKLFLKWNESSQFNILKK